MRWRSLGSIAVGGPGRAAAQLGVQRRRRRARRARLQRSRRRPGRAAGAGRGRRARRAGRGRSRRRRSAAGPARAARRSPRARARRTAPALEARVDGQEADRAGARAAPARRRRRRRSASPGRVDLQRVGRDGDRVLAALARSRVGQRDRHRGLAHAGRAEERDRRARRGGGPWRGVSSARWPVRIGSGLSTGAGRAGRRHRGGQAAPARASTGDACGPRGRVRLGRPPRGAGGDARGRPRGAGARGAGRLRRGRRARPTDARSRRAPPWRCGRPRSTAAGRLPFHASASQARGRRRRSRGLPELDGAAAAILLADPYTFPTDALLAATGRRARPACRCWAASRARARSTARAPCSCGDEVVERRRGRRAARRRRGPALRLAGRRADRARADDHRGRRPRDRTSSRARPRSSKLREVDRARSTSASARWSPSGLLVGIVGRRRQARLRQRRLPRARPARRRPGHRDGRRRRRVRAGPGRAPARARRRLGGPRPARGARAAHGGARRRAPAGALVFTCNGRGARMFGAPDHDARGAGPRCSRAPPPPGSSRRARSARSAARTSCTASRPRWRSSRVALRLRALCAGRAGAPRRRRAAASRPPRRSPSTAPRATSPALVA